MKKKLTKVDQDSKVKFTIVIDNDLCEKLDEESKKTMRTRNQEIKYILSKYFGLLE